jgi:hypothetical protein
VEGLDVELVNDSVLVPVGDGSRLLVDIRDAIELLARDLARGGSSAEASGNGPANEARS